MVNFIRYRALAVAATLAVAAQLASQSATADTIELNSFWAGSGTVTINFTGTNWHDGSAVTGLYETGGSGGFKTFDLTTDPSRKNGFQSFCVDIFHSFSFATSSLDVLKPAGVALAGSTATVPTIISSRAAADLGRLYTNHHDVIDSTSSSAANEAAFQLAVWEIVNERSGTYSLAGGDFKATGTGIGIAGVWLNELMGTASTSAYSADIWTVQSARTGGYGAQDVVVFTKITSPVPEPETYAMLLAGLGLIGFSARRRKNDIDTFD